MSNDMIQTVEFSAIDSIISDPDVGVCLNCGHKLTLCGSPFTADVVCGNCNKLNKFYNSKQPVSIESMDIIVVP